MSSLHFQTVPYGGHWGFPCFFLLTFFALLGRSLIFLDHRYYVGHENEGRRRKRTKDKGSAAHFLIRNPRVFLYSFFGRRGCEDDDDGDYEEVGSKRFF